MQQVVVCVVVGMALVAYTSALFNSAADVVNVPGKVVGTGIGGAWGAVAPRSVNEGAIKGAGGKVSGTKGNKGPVGKVGQTAGGAVGTAWQAVVPNSVRESSVKAAKKTGNVH